MEFVCPDPTASVRAANVKATLDAFNFTPSMGRRLIERHKLDLRDLRADHFVPVQRWLDALKDIQREVGTFMVRQVGANIIENADFPPNFTDPEAILLALDAIYRLNHRGEVGRYHAARDATGAIVVRCETPYPRHFEWGLVEGICRNRRWSERRCDIQFAEASAPGDVTCTLTVRRLK